MRETINEEVGVIMVYSARKRQALPHLISWQNREYKVKEVSYHHKVFEGKVLNHIFELTDTDKTLWFRLKLNTDNLHWVLEAVHDGRAN